MIPSLIPLKQKIAIAWSYNSQVFSPAEPDILGQLGISFLQTVDKITDIRYGLTGEYKIEYNNLMKKSDAGILFNDERIIDLSNLQSFDKNHPIIENFNLSFPSSQFYLPSSCLYFGDEQGYEPTLSVKYNLYVKISYLGGFKSNKEKSEVFNFPLTYQSSAMFQANQLLTYDEFHVFPLSSTSPSNGVNILNLKKVNNTKGLDLTLQLQIPSYIDLNSPFFPQINVKFITRTPIESFPANYSYRLKNLKLTLHYSAVFANKNSSNNYSKKKTVFDLPFENSNINLIDFKYDQNLSANCYNYQFSEYPYTTLKEVIGLHSFLTNSNLFDGKFANSTSFHLSFTIIDNYNNENIYKFKTDASPTVRYKEIKS